jgi:hypothetical protein
MHRALDLRREVISRLAGLALVVVLLSLAGCGAEATPASRPSEPGTSSSTVAPSAAPSSLPAATRQYRSPALGIAFLYPKDWELVSTDTFDTDGHGQASVQSPDHLSWFQFQVNSPRAAAGGSPGGFADATGDDLDGMVSFIDVESKVLTSGFTHLDGLLLAQVEFIPAPSPLGGEPHDRQVSLMSGVAPDGSTVTLGVGAPRAQWKARRHVLLKILASVRFSRPRGTQ